MPEEAASDMYAVRDISDATEDIPEQLGARPKFWFKGQDGEDWLFKEIREGTGEDWSEKIAAELCSALGIPHAEYELAAYKGRRGVITPKFLENEHRLVHGNELLSKWIKDYPSTQSYHVREHTLRIVLAVLKGVSASPPLGFISPKEIASGPEVFVGYLMLDALIGNQDRHHQNWGLVSAPNRGIFLAPTFDHASSLGRNENDDERARRLSTKDKGFTVDAFTSKARSAFYSGPNQKKAMKTHDAFFDAAARYPSAATAWLGRLSLLASKDMAEIVERVPPSIISPVASTFAKEMLNCNRMRLLHPGDQL
jgi:hypothetical protein